ncbi:transposase family protein [Streptomyces sp. NPDC050636]|uniref:transposase family protein n=1 Tax=Streptomyces sp. NPDC050636 TaxID=3154510 RepID=UPI00341514B2
MPTLADKGYIGAGIGILVPARRPKGRSEHALHADTRTTNNLIRGVRALGERAAAKPKQRWRTLQHITSARAEPATSPGPPSSSTESGNSRR